MNNKGADQPSHPRSLISIFVIRCLDSIIPLVSIFKISSLQLASLAEQTGLSLYLVANPEDRFSRDEAQMFFSKHVYLLLIFAKTNTDYLKEDFHIENEFTFLSLQFL